MKKVFLVLTITIALFSTAEKPGYAYWIDTAAGESCKSGDCWGWENPKTGKRWCQPDGTSGELTLGGDVCDCNSGSWENCGSPKNPKVSASGGGAGDIHNPLVQVEGVTALSNYIGTFWQVAYTIAGIAVLIYFVVGAISWLTAGGNEERVEKAQKTLSNAFIGLIILAASFPVIKLIEIVFGINILEITWPTP